MMTSLYRHFDPPFPHKLLKNVDPRMNNHHFTVDNCYVVTSNDFYIVLVN